MGASVGSSSFYVLISQMPEWRDDLQVRTALFIGKVKSFGDLDVLMKKWNVRACLISTKPEPHLVQVSRKESHHGK